MIRGAIYFVWMAASVTPYGAFLVVVSFFVSGRTLYWLALPWLRQITYVAKLVGGVDYRVHGADNLPGPESPDHIILCPKHQSTWETFALPTLATHPLAYVFKKELLMIPFFGWAMARLDMVHIDRSKRSEAWNKVAEQGRTLMDKGVWMIMFPEGTRTERGKQGIYKTGASRLAVATGASIIPVAVTSGRCWPRRTFRFVPGTIDVSFGKPISSAGREPAELMKEVETWIEAEMHRLDPEAYAA